MVIVRGVETGGGREPESLFRTVEVKEGLAVVSASLLCLQLSVEGSPTHLDKAESLSSRLLREVRVAFL